MNEETGSWVVYLMTIHNQHDGRRAVCSQADWDALDRARPCYHRLLHTGIPNEHDAELLARGTSGDAVSRVRKFEFPTPVARGLRR